MQAYYIADKTVWACSHYRKPALGFRLWLMRA